MCKGLSSHKWYGQVTHLRAPLDSTVIYPITRSPTTTVRPVKEKTYQDHTFALRIPLELDDDDLVLLKVEHLSWLCMLALAWWSLANCSPILLWERLSFRHVFTSPWSPYRWQASSMWSLRDVHLELAHWLDLSCISLNHYLILLLFFLKPTYGLPHYLWTNPTSITQCKH